MHFSDVEQIFDLLTLYQQIYAQFLTLQSPKATIVAFHASLCIIMPQQKYLYLYQNDSTTTLLTMKFRIRWYHFLTTCTWFLEIAFVCKVGMSACVCVCPRGYKSHSRDIEPVQPAEQVCCVQKCNKAFYVQAWLL